MKIGEILSIAAEVGLNVLQRPFLEIVLQCRRYAGIVGIHNVVIDTHGNTLLLNSIARSPFNFFLKPFKLRIAHVCDGRFL